ncbi:hypothetical protein BHE74_00051981 [Ensete ventricosum]|nr:hypothetical protein GW17_00054546 [Ensete ventricosum]RWW42470.1 hypothetical protein BHE74_00051981 [Ensete ventricosum]RZR92246.1 hypothetical protein BHM03_00020521 [Ensete ventricosum]
MLPHAKRPALDLYEALKARKILLTFFLRWRAVLHPPSCIKEHITIPLHTSTPTLINRKHFGSLQSLGGHMTTHRREMEELRRQHEAYMASHRLPRPAVPTPAARSSMRMLRPRHCRLQEARGIYMTPLAANHAFWAAYRSTDRLPPFINFMEVMEPEAVAARPLLQVPQQEVHQVESSEDTLSDPLVAPSREEEGDEVNS